MNKINSMDTFLDSITDPQFSLPLEDSPKIKESTSHFQLCRQTAEWALRKKGDIALWEYDGGSSEKPDVLLFHGHTSYLYEIKMSRSDFRADRHKEARTKWKPRSIAYFNYVHRDKKKFPELKKYVEKWSYRNPELYYIEAPHLGMYRYYVCPSGLIKPEEIPDGWGLYWVKNGRYYQKKKSGKFRRNLYQENILLVSALRKNLVSEGNDKNIAFKNWEKREVEVK